MSPHILLKEELDFIIKSLKYKKNFSYIGKQLNRSPINIKNEFNKYLKETNHNGTSLYTLSKEFNIPLEKIKNVVENTKLNDFNYLEKNKVDKICELLKTKKKYVEIAKILDTSKDTVLLYFKRNLNEQISKGTSCEELSELYCIKNTCIQKLIDKPKFVLKIKKKTKVELLEEENKNLKEIIKNLRKKNNKSSN